MTILSLFLLFFKITLVKVVCYFRTQDQPLIVSRVRNSFRQKYSKKDVEEAQAKYSELVGT